MAQGRGASAGALIAERGASAVEYGLIVAAIAAMIVVIVFVFGSLVQDQYNDTCTSLAGQLNNPTVSCAP